MSLTPVLRERVLKATKMTRSQLLSATLRLLSMSRSLLSSQHSPTSITCTGFLHPTLNFPLHLHLRLQSQSTTNKVSRALYFVICSPELAWGFDERRAVVEYYLLRCFGWRSSDYSPLVFIFSSSLLIILIIAVVPFIYVVFRHETRPRAATLISQSKRSP
jgi:hypothetical protein